MAFEINKDSTQFAQFVTLIIFTPLGIAVTALRFVGVRRVTRKVGVEDWLAVIATIFFILTNLAGLMGKQERFILQFQPALLKCDTFLSN
jgi:hypothetical protein